MTRVTKLTLLTAAAALLAGTAFAQAPAEMRSDPGTANPSQPQTQSETAPPAAGNPEATVGLRPADQPVNNANPRVAGEVVPSSQATAAHDESIFEHDRQPIISHTFNFTADQKRDIAAALAGEDAVAVDAKADFTESVVVPPSVPLQPVPDRIAQQMPWVKRYLFVKTKDAIVLVDPIGRYVAAVIDSSSTAL
ncbi:hypothetical protein [Pseudorhodoplanes sp.]|uniref:hypothetical protein n=1 Tax=Pseudorhodoplanes sp. TaxID=1934341 RepID=UPI00391AC969